LWWRSSGNSEPGRAVADGTPPSVVAAVAQIDNMLEQCFTDTIMCGRVDPPIEFNQAFGFGAIALQLANKMKNNKHKGSRPLPAADDRRLTEEERRSMRAQVQSQSPPDRPPRAEGCVAFFEQAARKQEKSRRKRQNEVAAAAAAVDESCGLCGNYHGSRGSPSPYSLDIYASNVVDFRHLDNEQLVSMALGVAQQLIAHLSHVATKARHDPDILAPADHMWQDVADTNRVCKGIITTALDNLCAVETIMQQRHDNAVAKSLARRLQRAHRDEDEVRCCCLFENC